MPHDDGYIFHANEKVTNFLLRLSHARMQHDDLKRSPAANIKIQNHLSVISLRMYFAITTSFLLPRFILHFALPVI